MNISIVINTMKGIEKNQVATVIDLVNYINIWLVFCGNEDVSQYYALLSNFIWNASSSYILIGRKFKNVQISFIFLLKFHKEVHSDSVTANLIGKYLFCVVCIISLCLPL